MNDDTLTAILTRLKRAERTGVQHRVGVVTALSPLTVQLSGGASTVAGINSIAGHLAVNDVVSVLIFNSDALVLGRIPGASTTWVEATLINSWANVGGAFETAGYMKDALGFVHLKGVVQSGATDTVMFVLPAGFRPGAKTSNAAGATPNTASLQIQPNGNVASVWTGGSATFLSGVTFLAEN